MESRNKKVERNARIILWFPCKLSMLAGIWAIDLIPELPTRYLQLKSLLRFPKSVSQIDSYSRLRFPFSPLAPSVRLGCPAFLLFFPYSFTFFLSFIKPKSGNIIFRKEITDIRWSLGGKFDRHRRELNPWASGWTPVISFIWPTSFHHKCKFMYISAYTCSYMYIYVYITLC